MLSSQNTAGAGCLSLPLEPGTQDLKVRAVVLDPPSLGLERTLSSFSKISTAISRPGPTLRETNKQTVCLCRAHSQPHLSQGHSVCQEPASGVAGVGTFLCCVIVLIPDVFFDSQE